MASAFIGNGVKRIDKITYYPAQEEFIDEGSITYYNLWNNPGIKPCKGNVDVLLEHIEYLFPDKEQRDVFLDFLAHNIQFPGTRILWMLIVYGEEEGTGKASSNALCRHSSAMIMLARQAMKKSMRDFRHGKSNASLL